jgi:hypothetical protein
MKFILVIALAIFSMSSYASKNLLLHCLAKEEERLHKNKDQSALYRLNQNFLNELSSNNDIAIKKNFIDEICSNKSLSPSIEFLRILLIYEQDIYDLSLSKVDNSMRPYKMGYIYEFQKQVPHLLFSYISGIEAETPEPNCFRTAISELGYFSDKIKYLEDEIEMHKILSDKPKLHAIFKKLKDFKKIKKACDKKYSDRLKLIEEKNQKAKTLKN